MIGEDQYTVNRHTEDPEKNEVFIQKDDWLIQVGNIYEKLNVLPKSLRGDAAAKAKAKTTSLQS
jgi:hypothetical protein